MRNNPQLKQDLAKYKNHIILVEGKKDVNSLKSLGFEKVYAIHESGLSLRERLEKISLQLNKKDKLCILTDFDKKGKHLYLKIKSELQNLGVKLDASLRSILLKANISHVECLATFFGKIEEGD